MADSGDVLGNRRVVRAARHTVTTVQGQTGPVATTAGVVVAVIGRVEFLLSPSMVLRSSRRRCDGHETRSYTNLCKDGIAATVVTISPQRGGSPSRMPR